MPSRERASTTYNITELAAEFDITARAIRFYEDVGLLTPARAGRNRVYSHRDRTRLKLTLRGKRLGLSLQDMDRRFVALSHDPAVADQMAAAHPLLKYRAQGGVTALFDGEPPESVRALGRRVRPSLVDLFVALTRKPELDRQHF